jgi:uncharacterized RDD family membrane protein YckC
MDQNPYLAPKADPDGPAAPAASSPAAAAGGTVLYARLGVRFRAYLIDYFLMLGLFLLTAMVGGWLQSVPGAGAVLFTGWVAFALLYEPVMVSRTGGTIGHHLKNLRVVSARTGGHPGFLAALVRSLAKWVLGGISALLIMASGRAQAIHDAIANVTVQFKDPTLARRNDYIRGPS